ncbi:MAG: hypothetical protein Q9228_008002, partial [Teloschistes exilis]
WEHLVSSVLFRRYVNIAFDPKQKTLLKRFDTHIKKAFKAAVANELNQAKNALDRAMLLYEEAHEKFDTMFEEVAVDIASDYVKVLGTAERLHAVTLRQQAAMREAMGDVKEFGLQRVNGCTHMLWNEYNKNNAIEDELRERHSGIESTGIFTHSPAPMYDVNGAYKSFSGIDEISDIAKWNKYKKAELTLDEDTLDDDE